MIRLLLVLGLLGLGALFVVDRLGDESLPGLPDVPFVGEERDGGGQERTFRRARCPDGVEGCRAVLGRIVYVERVDPDGDGDLHVVVADGGISGPGITAIDVRPGLRPEHDPRVGDRATAAGPVQPGSFGQDQIHALRFRVHRLRG